MIVAWITIVWLIVGLLLAIASEYLHPGRCSTAVSVWIILAWPVLAVMVLFNKGGDSGKHRIEK